MRTDGQKNVQNKQPLRPLNYSVVLCDARA